MERPDAPPIPLDADEATMLTSFLDFYRFELIDRAFGLSDEQLRATHPPSTLSLARLIGHMALVEESWFCVRFCGDEPEQPWADFDWDADADAEMTWAEGQGRDELIARFDLAVERARRVVAAMGSLDQLAAGGGERRHSMRWILIHMIEEYARHCGHADLIREAIDGDLAR